MNQKDRLRFFEADFQGISHGILDKKGVWNIYKTNVPRDASPFIRSNGETVFYFYDYNTNSYKFYQKK